MNNSKETSIKNLLEKDGIIQEENQEKKSYTLRKLSSKDIKPMLKIIKKFNIKRIKEAFNEVDFSEIIKTSKKEANEGESTEIEEDTNTIMNIGKDVVFEIIPMLIDALEDCIDEVNALLASVANMDVESLENLDLDVYFSLIYDFINKKEFTGFMKVVSKFLNSEK